MNDSVVYCNNLSQNGNFWLGRKSIIASAIIFIIITIPPLLFCFFLLPGRHRHPHGDRLLIGLLDEFFIFPCPLPRLEVLVLMHHCKVYFSEYLIMGWLHRCIFNYLFVNMIMLIELFLCYDKFFVKLLILSAKWPDP